MTKDKSDAIELLKADHREVETLFKKYEAAKEADKKQEKYEIARQVCAALLVHMELEEMLFYPAAQEVISKEELVDEAIVEHKGAKTIIKELGSTSIDSSMFDAKVSVLCEQIQHHVDEEENQLFPMVSESELDLEELGEKITKQKEQLCSEHHISASHT